MARTSPPAALVALVALAVPVLAAGPQFWRLEGARAFLGGEIDGLSLDSEGRLRLGLLPRPVFDPETPRAWALARDARGVLYVGTGSDGRLLRVEGTRGSVLFDADELEIHAVAVAPDGRVYAATSPDGAVYAIEPSGASRRFFDPEEKYVWALAVDRTGRLYVGTGGEGRVYRVAPDGRSEAVLTTTETHVLSLAIDGQDRVYAGSAPEGIVYRIDGPGKVFALLDSEFREVKALDVAADGTLYAAVIDGQTAGSTPAAPAPPSPAGAAGVVAEVTVSESFAIAPPGGTPGAAATAGGEGQAPGPPRGALLRVRPTGEIDTLWSSPEDVPHAARLAAGGVLVGTGNKGKLYRVEDDGTWALVASLAAEQVTGVLGSPEGAAFLVTSNPARVFAVDATRGTEGTFVSKPRDAGTVASWGRLSWEGQAPAGTGVRLQTRAGNTATPDATWSDWSAPAGRGDAIRSEKARFLQLRLTLAGRDGLSPTVEAVSAAYLQRNLPPVVTSVTVHPAGEVFQKPITVSGEPEILGLDSDPLSERAAASRPPAGSPPAVSFSRKLVQRGLRTFSWQAEDPNGDPLLFSVLYRAAADDRWHTLREELSEPVFTWDTASVPDGRYVIRVSASDSPGNPPALALGGSEDSASFEVDNTPPSLSASLEAGRPGRIRATVHDDATPVRRLEISIDAGRWEEVHPVDGIADSIEESYDIALPPSTGGRRTVVLRASDRLGNVATARVDVP